MFANNDPAAMVLVARTPFLRAPERRQLLTRHRTYTELVRLSHEDVEQIIGRPLVRERWNPRRDDRSVTMALRELERLKCTVVHFDDIHYPPMLRAIADPPAVLFVRGAVSALQCTTIAIVGTRHPNAAAVRAASDLGAAAARDGVVVASGLAFGCDAAAHAGMLRARGIGVAVLGTGIDQLSPRANRPLAVGVLSQGGAIVSEYPPGTAVRKYHFPARNRIIVGLAAAVVIVQAPHRSGALFSAGFALDEGRPLYVHAVGAAEDEENGLNGGTAALVRDGAPIIETFTDIPPDPVTLLTGGRFQRSAPNDERMASRRIDQLFGPAIPDGTLAFAREVLVESAR